MENFGQKTLSSHAVKGSDGIAWGSALPRQRGFKGGSVGRHIDLSSRAQYGQATPAGQPQM
jgi:hypothetical protein